MTTMNTITLKDLKEEFKFSGDSGDPWGSCLSVHFQLADYLHFKRSASVPQHWEYSPGLGSDIDPEWENFFESTPLEQLIQFGNILERYANILRTQGKDY